jgi:hypothetical protein
MFFAAEMLAINEIDQRIRDSSVDLKQLISWHMNALNYPCATRAASLGE